MRAVVLVGGFGTRMRPLTLTTPKPLLPVGQRPLVEHVVEHLGRHGVTEAVLSIGFKPDAFRAAYPDGTCAGVGLVYAVEPTPLDTAGAVRFAALFAGIDDTFVVVNGDVLTDVDLGALIAHHRASGAEGTIHLTPVEDPSAFGVVPTDVDGRVLAFIEKPARHEAPTNYINAGTYVLEASVIDRIPADRPVSIEREVFPAMVADGTLHAVPSTDYWLDAGRPELYLQANFDAVVGVRRFVREAAVAEDVTSGPGATIERAVIGTGAFLGAGATVSDSLVMEGAVVAAGASVLRSVVGVGSTVGEDARLVDTVIGNDIVIPAGAVLEGQRIPAPD